MTEENLEWVRESYRLVNEGGFAAIADRIDPDFEMDSPQGIEASQAHDKAGLELFFKKMDEIWEVMRFDPKEMIEVDAARIIVVVHTSGHARGSGIEIDQDLTHLWTLRGGKAIRLVTYSTKREALEAAGSSD